MRKDWTNEDFEFLLEKVNAGEIILVADHDLGIPTIHGIAGTEHDGFGFFTATTAEYTVQFEGGTGMPRTPSGKGYTKVKVLRGVFPYNCQQVAQTIEDLISE